MRSLLFAVALVGTAGIAVPTPQQLAYQDLEVGVLIHFNAQTLCNSDPGNYTGQRCEKEGHMPSDEVLRAWNPSALDTDKWVSAAVSFGAQYAVLAVDHFSGFTMWPTKQHNYSIAMTSWKGGRGDVFGDFVRSCRKFGVRPGFFYSVHNNWHQHVSNYVAHSSSEQQAFNALAAAQMRELLNGDYGELLGVWFDAGVHTDVNPDILPLVQQLQPGILCHSCTNGTQDPQDPSKGYGLRWAGNEGAAMPLPSWGAAPASAGFHHQVTGKGNPLGEIYNPPEADTVLREHFWFWWKDTESTIKSTDKLVNAYFTSVGHAANFILDMAPDPTGAVPSVDVSAYAQLGTALRCLFSKPLLNSTAWVGTPSPWELRLHSPVQVGTNLIVSMKEDLTAGQLIDNWVLEWQLPSGWATAATGQSLGHKRLLGGHGELTTTGTVTAFRLNVTSVDDSHSPHMAAFAVFNRPSNCIPSTIPIAV